MSGPPSVRPGPAAEASTRHGALLILGFVAFTTAFGAHIVAVNLPVYAEQVGVGVAIIGVLIAIYDLAEIVAKPLCGALADRQGMKPTMLAGLLVFTLASVTYPWIDPRFLFLVRFVQGLGAAALSAVSLALVGVYEPRRRGRAYGVYNAIKGAGYVVSPVIGGAIVWKSHFGAIFLATAAVGGLAFVLSLGLPRPPRPADGVGAGEDDGVSLAALRAVFQQRGLWPWYVITVVNTFYVGILFGFLPVRVHALGYDPLTTGLLLTTVAASYLLVQPVAGALADRVGPAGVIQAAMVLSALTIIALPFVRDGPLLVVSILAGLGIGTVWTNADTLISGLARAGRVGATMGVAGSFKEFGDMAGPLLIGLMAQAWGLTTAFMTCGILGLSVLAVTPRGMAPGGGVPTDPGHSG